MSLYLSSISLFASCGQSKETELEERYLDSLLSRSISEMNVLYIPFNDKTTSFTDAN